MKTSSTKAVCLHSLKQLQIRQLQKCKEVLQQAARALYVDYDAAGAEYTSRRYEGTIAEITNYGRDNFRILNTIEHTIRTVHNLESELSERYSTT